MDDPKPESNPWTLVGQQSVRMPERIPRKTVVRKSVGFVLLGLGGIVMTFFAFCCLALYYGIRQMDNPDVPSITASDIAIALSAGMIGLALLAAGYWIFRGSLPQFEKFPD